MSMIYLNRPAGFTEHPPPPPPPQHTNDRGWVHFNRMSV